MGHVFLSYAHDDAGLASRVEEVIQSAGAEVWRDVHKIVGGQIIWTRIESAIANSKCLVVLVTPSSHHKKTIQHEVEYAIVNNIPVIPLLQNFPMNGLPEWWSLRVGHLHIIQFNRFVAAPRDDIKKAIIHHLQPASKAIALFNMKGGVGKTTLTAQIAARLNVQHGQRVLLIDMDPQQNLTEMCIRTQDLDSLSKLNRSIIGLFEPNKINVEYQTIDDFAVNAQPNPNADYNQLVYKLNGTDSRHERFDILPGDHRAIKYVQNGDAGTLEANFLRGIERLKFQYDYIIFDCNPSVSFFTRAVLRASQFLLIPIKPDAFARRGVAFIDNLITKFYQLEERPQINAVFNFVSKNPTSREEKLKETLRGGGGGSFKDVAWLSGGYLNTEIPESGKLQVNFTGLQKSSAFAEDVIAMANSQPVGSYLDSMVTEYLKRIKGHGNSQPQNARAAE
jgi:chromosome partitioning protein